MPHMKFKKIRQSSVKICNQNLPINLSNTQRRLQCKDYTQVLSYMIDPIVSLRVNETRHYAGFFQGKNHWLEKVRYWCKSYFT